MSCEYLQQAQTRIELLNSVADENQKLRTLIKKRDLDIADLKQEVTVYRSHAQDKARTIIGFIQQNLANQDEFAKVHNQIENLSGALEHLRGRMKEAENANRKLVNENHKLRKEKGPNILVRFYKWVKEIVP